MRKFNWRPPGRRLEEPASVTDESPIEDATVTEEVTEEATTPIEAPAGLVRILGEVASLPVVNRNDAGQVTSIEFAASVPFQGRLTVKATGAVASAYWSITPGMDLAINGRETGDKEFTAESIDVLP